MRQMIVIGSYTPILIDKIFLVYGKFTVTLHSKDVRATSTAFRNIKEALERNRMISFCGDAVFKVRGQFFSVTCDVLSCDVCFHFLFSDIEVLDD